MKKKGKIRSSIKPSKSSPGKPFLKRGSVENARKLRVFNAALFCQKIPYNLPMRKFLIALAFMLGIVFIITRFAEINHILEVLKRGSLPFLGLAILVELLWMYNLGAFFQSVYTILGMLDRRFYLLRLVTAANFLNIVAPSGGLSGLAIFISDARRRKRSTARVTIAGLLFVWFDYWGILLLLTLGLGDLQKRGALHWAEITAALMLLTMALGISLLLYLGLHSTKALGALLAGSARVANFITYPFTRRHIFTVEHAYSFSAEIAEGISILRYRSNWALLPSLYAIMNKLLQIVLLGLCFLAFQVKLEIGAIVAGLSLAQLFLIISPTPSGLGIVEGVLTIALTTLGIELSDAAVITLAYRAFSFWLPFLTGMISFRTLGLTRPSSPDQSAFAVRDFEG